MQKGRIKLNAVERKYIVVALRELRLEHSHNMQLAEKLLLDGLIRKINSGIRYNRRGVVKTNGDNSTPLNK